MISRLCLHLVVEFRDSISSVISRLLGTLRDLSAQSLNWWSVRDKFINIADSGLQGCDGLLSFEWFSTFRRNVLFLH
jgi:hypothetical protein